MLERALQQRPEPNLGHRATLRHDAQTEACLPSRLGHDGRRRFGRGWRRLRRHRLRRRTVPLRDRERNRDRRRLGDLLAARPLDFARTRHTVGRQRAKRHHVRSIVAHGHLHVEGDPFHLGERLTDELLDLRSRLCPSIALRGRSPAQLGGAHEARSERNRGSAKPCHDRTVEVTMHARTIPRAVSAFTLTCSHSSAEPIHGMQRGDGCPAVEVHDRLRRARRGLWRRQAGSGAQGVHQGLRPMHDAVGGAGRLQRHRLRSRPSGAVPRLPLPALTVGCRPVLGTRLYSAGMACLSLNRSAANAISASSGSAR